MKLIKKYGPLLSIALIVLALGFLFLPYVRAGLDGSHYAIGYLAIFDIKNSGLTYTVTRDGGPSVMLIIAFVLMVVSLAALPFSKREKIIPFVFGIALLAAGVVFFFGHLILIVNLRSDSIAGTFGLYLVATLVMTSGLSSLLAGIQYLHDEQEALATSRYSYIRK